MDEEFVKKLDEEPISEPDHSEKENSLDDEEGELDMDENAPYHMAPENEFDYGDEKAEGSEYGEEDDMVSDKNS